MTSRWTAIRDSRGAKALGRWASSPITWALFVIVLAWLYVFPYSARLNNPNERTRMMQTRAVADLGQLHIGEAAEGRRGRLEMHDIYGRVHRGMFVNDMALVCHDPEEEPPKCEGLLYPAKAPGTALSGVPAVKLGSAVGFVGDEPEDEAKVTWLIRIFGVALPMLVALMALALLLRRAELSRRLTAKVLLGVGLGTAVFPYSIMAVGHALAGGCAIVGVALLEEARRRRWPIVWAAFGGFITASAVIMEYHAFLLVAPVAVWVVLSRARWRLVPGFALGSLGALAVHSALHIAMFGSALRTGHFFLLSQHNREGQEAGFLGIDSFRFEALGDTLLDPYMGLIPLMPWLFMGAWVGLPKLLRGEVPGISKGAGRALAAMPILYLVFVSMLAQWRTMNGWSIGPRYLVPAMMATAFVAGIGWHHLVERRRIAGSVLSGLVAASMVIIAAITVVFPQPPASVHNPFVELAKPLLAEGVGVRNIGLVLGLGKESLEPFFVLIFIAAGWVAIAWGARGAAASWKTRLIAALVALAVAGGWLWGMERWPLTKDPRAVAHGQDFIRKNAEGWHPDREPTFWKMP